MMQRKERKYQFYNILNFGDQQRKMTIRGRIYLKGMYDGGTCTIKNVKFVKLKGNVRAYVNIDNLVNHFQL